MTWFLFAVIATFLWSTCSHLDKFLLSRKGGEIGTQIIFSSLFGIAVVPFIAVFYPAVLIAPPFLIACMIFAGWIGMLGILLYLYALEREETTLVVPWFQIVPIFSYVYGSIFLAEHLSSSQLTGVILVVIGAAGISFDIDTATPRFKLRPVLFMLASAVLLAGTTTIFKYTSSASDYWTANFWSYTGEISMGFIFLFIPRFRRQFQSVFQNRAWLSLRMNTANEILNIIASLLFRVSLVLAPVALSTAAVTGLQPIFVFLSGIVITALLPGLGRERITKKHLFHRAIFLLITFAGTIFLNL